MIGLLAFLALTASAQQARPADTAEARRAIQAYGACVADSSPEKAAQTLAMDFTTVSYRSALRNLSSANEGCMRERGRMRAGGLLLAGAIAERLLAKDPTPLNARLAAAVSQPAPPARAPSDRVAICVARAAPDDVAKLFETPVESNEEAAAVQALSLPITLCSKGGPKLEASVDGLRAMLATAAFRSVDEIDGAGN